MDLLFGNLRAQITMQPANQSLQAAYDRCRLAEHGISFERATTDPAFKIGLTHVAEALEKPYVPLPKHKPLPHWQDKD